MLPFLRDERESMNDIIMRMSDVIDKNKEVADEIRWTIRGLEEFVASFNNKGVKNDN